MSKGTAHQVFGGNTADTAASSLAIGDGYMLRSPTPIYAKANGWMSFDGQGVPLWIYEYETGFTLAGSTAQSQMVRTMFPRNFQQPQYAIRCQAPNQHEYGRVAEFVRYLQRKAISTGRPGLLQVNGGGIPVRSGTRGVSKGFMAEGWVEQIERGGQFGEFAPQFEFNFVISRMLSGLYTDTPVTMRQLKSWAEILKDNPGDVGYVLDPDHADPTKAGQQVANIAEQIAAGGAWDWVQGRLGLR